MSEMQISLLGQRQKMREKELEDKRKLRTILVAPELSKSVDEICEYFNFGIKNLYKYRITTKKEPKKNLTMGNLEEVIRFIKRRKNLVNISMIARYFGIRNATASDIVLTMESKGMVSVQEFGISKLVMVAEK